MDEPVSEAIMCDNYRKTEELKVGVCVAITSIAKSIDTSSTRTTVDKAIDEGYFNFPKFHTITHLFILYSRV